MPNKKNYGLRSVFMKNRLVVFVVVSALSMAVLSCGGGKAKGSEGTAFDGTWTEQSYGVTLVIEAPNAAVKDGDIILAKGTIVVTGNTATVTSTEIADANNELQKEELTVPLTLEGGTITADFEGTTYTFSN
jgi:hypothetical protein